MSNGARHTWGFFVGVVLTAALAGLLIFGSYRLQHGYLTEFHKQDKWIGGGLLLGAAVVFAILAASRLSPLASLVGGIVLTAAGVLFFISQKTTADLINLQDISVEKSGVIPSMLNFGDVVCQTAGGASNFRIAGVPDPTNVQLLIDKERDRARRQDR